MFTFSCEMYIAMPAKSMYEAHVQQAPGCEETTFWACLNMTQNSLPFRPRVNQHLHACSRKKIAKAKQIYLESRMKPIQRKDDPFASNLLALTQDSHQLRSNLGDGSVALRSVLLNRDGLMVTHHRAPGAPKYMWKLSDDITILPLYYLYL